MPTSALPISFALANGVYSFDLAPGSTGQAEIKLTTLAVPTAGTMKVEVMRWEDGTYETFGTASAVNLATASWPLFLTDYGHYRNIRFTLTGVTGGSGPVSGNLYETQNAISPTLVNGTQALTTQTFAEVGAKMGTSFFAQVTLPSIAIAATYNMVFTTGALPVILQDLRVYAQVTSMSFQLFKAPTFSGGTAVTALNLNDVNPQTSTVTILNNATVAAAGTSWGDPFHLYGASTLGAVAGASIQTLGLRVLAPNKSYLLQFKNAATLSVATPDVYMSWLEGVPDLPRS